jgi:hypothetical protein
MGLLALVVAIGTSSAGADAADTLSANRSVYPLTVVESKPPRIRWSCRSTNIGVGGMYPQVFDKGAPLRAVNAALRASALADERSLIAGGCPPGRIGPAPAIYKPHPEIESMISASSVVVSALILAESSPPGANFSYGWAAVTVRVATATPVSVAELFQSPREGLRAVAAAARARLAAQLSARKCWVQSPTSTGIAPTTSNYRYFALTTRGLAIGFTAGVVAPRVCGQFSVTIPYEQLYPHFGKLGRELVTGVRRPLK